MSEELRRILDELSKRLERNRNGTNWRTSKESKSSPADKPNPSTGGSKALAAYQRARRTAIAKATSQRASLSPFINAFYGTYYEQDYVRRASGKWAPPWMAGELGIPNRAKEWQPHYDAAALQSEGVQAGEIIAWRAWHWNGKRLRSIFVDYEWPIEGKPAKGRPDIGYGLHAYKSEFHAIHEYRMCSEDVIIGQVALWGDVIEFDFGYVAEFGKVLSLPAGTPKEIRKLYNVED